MNRYNVHFSSSHDLYYVIETEPSGRGRIVYAHAWRMCADYVAERHEAQLRQGEKGPCPDIQEITAMTQRNALFPCPAMDAAERQAGGRGWLALRRLVRLSRRRLARHFRHSTRAQSLPPLIESGC
jgi:hypothetical protein